jgi:hypothetical protein
MRSSGIWNGCAQAIVMKKPPENDFDHIGDCTVSVGKNNKALKNIFFIDFCFWKC